MSHINIYTNIADIEKAAKPPLPCCVDFAVYPLGTTVSFEKYIEQVETVLKQLGLTYHVHKQGTIIEGEMLAIMYAIKCCHSACLALGSARIISNIRVDTGMDNYKTGARSTAAPIPTTVD
ncbi:hypothetical protein EDD21DRAFT_391959 [Dissophora ornata]|nr:hypothetical protein BGZ58_006009 [Dissophora ornata]KAI8595145.1 hypothetical protein EDD21DRAFT_391959 [Dissophora ornata]